MTDGKDKGATRAADKAKARATKGSVHEAIGKLIGDDAASAFGSAEQRAVADDAPAARKPPRR